MVLKVSLVLGTVVIALAGYANSDTGYAESDQESAAVELELVRQFDPAKSEFPKGITFDSEGNVYFCMQLLGEIRKLSPDGSLETLATIPFSGSIGGGLLAAIGLIEGNGAADDVIYASFTDVETGDATGVYRISADGALARLPGTEAITGNGMAVEGDHIYVADSFHGSIWRISHDTGLAELWIHDALLEGDGSVGFGVPLGVGGITVDGQSLLVTVEEKSRIVRINFNQDGSAGSLSVVAEDPSLYLAEGIAVAPDGTIYISSWFRSTLGVLDDNGTLSVIADTEDGLVGPVTLAFGKGPFQGFLYVVNQSAFIFDNPNPALYRVIPGLKPSPSESPTATIVPSATPVGEAPLPPSTGTGAAMPGDAAPLYGWLGLALVVIAGWLVGASAWRRT